MSVAQWLRWLVTPPRRTKSAKKRPRLDVVSLEDRWVPANFTQVAQLLPTPDLGDTTRQNNLMGVSVALAGDTAVVGVENDSGIATDGGAAYVYLFSSGSWIFQQRLVANDAAEGDRFGHSVAIDGDTIVVGADGADSPTAENVGGVYVFTRSAGVWSLQEKLTAADGEAGDLFGISVGVAGDTAVIGAASDDLGAEIDAGSAYVFTRTADDWSLQEKLTAPDAAGNDFFGAAVAIHNDTTIIGAPFDDLGAEFNAGSAYAFTRTAGDWVTQVQFSADLPQAGDFFGTSVAFDVNTAVVGAPNDDGAMGSVYVFIRDADLWFPEAQLVASDGVAGDQFGATVGVNGDSVIVGAVTATLAGEVTGAAYVFTRSDGVWSEEQRLNASDGADGDRFGFATAIRGDHALIGAPTDTTFAGASAGSAYFYERDAGVWGSETKVEASVDDSRFDFFGFAAAIDGDTAVVGAQGDDLAGVNAGSASIYVRLGTAWVFQQKVIAPDAAAGDLFGISVDVSGDTLVVGALFNDTIDGVDAGAAYVYTRLLGVWTFQAKLTASDAAPNAHFGHAVAIDGDTVVVGAGYFDTPTEGSAYAFARDAGVWTEEQILAPENPAPIVRFGDSVAIDNDTLVVGSITTDTLSEGQAVAAHIFVKSLGVWTEQQTLTTASDFAGTDTLYFTTSVAVDANTLVVGTGGNNAAIAGAAIDGAAFVFTRTDDVWTSQETLVASETELGNFFGYSVTVDGDTVVVGATNAESNLARTGAAYVFTRTLADWSEQQTLVALDAADADQFGFPVALSGSTLIVGANNKSTSVGPQSGAAYLFENVECDLVITKTESLDPVVAGSGTGNLTYVVTVANLGPANATDIVIDENLSLPAGVAIVSITPSAGNLVNTTVPYGRWLIPTLASGASATLTYVLTVGSSTMTGSNVISNTASIVSANEPLINTDDDTATVRTSVIRQVDLRVTTTESGDPVVAGSGASNLTYVVTVANLGDSDASAITVADNLTLPAGISIASITPSTGSYATTVAPDGTWTIPSLAAGTNATLTVVLTIGASTASGFEVVGNTATITGAAELRINIFDDSSAVSTSVARQVDLQVTMTKSGDPVRAGSGAGNLTYMVTVANVGPSDASGIVVGEDLTLPAGVTIASITPSLGSHSFTTAPDGAWAIPTLARGASATLTIVLTVGVTTTPGADVIHNTAMITAVNETRLNMVNDAASVRTSVVNVDLRVTATDSLDPVVAGFGDGLVHQVTVTNLGQATATGIAVSDDLTLPTGVTVISTFPFTGTFTPTTAPDGTWTIPSLAPGASTTLAVRLRIPSSVAAGANVIANTATITAADQALANTTDDSATASTSIRREVRLSITKTDDEVVFLPGDTITYAIRYQNYGESNATGVTITDTIPANTTFNAALSNAGWVVPNPAAGGVATLNLGTLAARTSGEIRFVVNVDAPLAADISTISNTAVITSDGTALEVNLADNTATQATSRGTPPIDPLPPGTSDPEGTPELPPGAGTTLLVTGADAGGPAHVKAFDSVSGNLKFSFFAYEGFQGGVRVASGDVNGDTVPDLITGTGLGFDHIKVFDGVNGSLLRSFLAFGGFNGGVQVAAGDINGDGLSEIIVGSATYAGHVKAFDGASGMEILSFFAFSGFQGGVTVAAGDINGDGLAEIVVGTATLATHVKAFDVLSGGEIRSFFAFAGSLGGVTVAVGDIDGDGLTDIITGAGPGAGPHVKVFDGATGAETRSFLAKESDYSGGVRVAAIDRDDDGRAEIVVSTGANRLSRVRTFSPDLAVLDDFVAFEGFTFGVFVG